MHYALPHPQRTLAIPLATLALGAGAGVAATVALNDDTIVFRNSPPAAAKVDARDTPAPVPERVSPSPAVVTGSDRSSAPVPERVSPAPAKSSTDSEALPPRISGAHTR